MTPHKSHFLRALPVGMLSILMGCTGGLIADITPGTRVNVEGIPFTVAQTTRGITVRNFETGRTDPALLLTYAGRAAQMATGCPLTHITKETGVNTYYAAVSCPTP